MTEKAHESFFAAEFEDFDKLNSDDGEYYPRTQEEAKVYIQKYSFWLVFSFADRIRKNWSKYEIKMAKKVTWWNLVKTLLKNLSKF